MLFVCLHGFRNERLLVGKRQWLPADQIEVSAAELEYFFVCVSHFPLPDIVLSSVLERGRSGFGPAERHDFGQNHHPPDEAGHLQGGGQCEGGAEVAGSIDQHTGNCRCNEARQAARGVLNANPAARRMRTRNDLGNREDRG